MFFQTALMFMSYVQAEKKGGINAEWLVAYYIRNDDDSYRGYDGRQRLEINKIYICSSL